MAVAVLAVIVLADMSDKSLRNPDQTRRVLGVDDAGGGATSVLEVQSYLTIIDPVVTYSVGLVIPPRDPMTPLVATLVQIAREVAPTLEA